MSSEVVDTALQRLSQLRAVEVASAGTCESCEWAYCGFLCQHPGVVEWSYDLVTGRVRKPENFWARDCRKEDGLCGPTGTLYQMRVESTVKKPRKWWQKIFRSGD